MKPSMLNVPKIKAGKPFPAPKLKTGKLSPMSAGKIRAKVNSALNSGNC